MPRDRKFDASLLLSLDGGSEHELKLHIVYHYEPGYAATQEEPGAPDSVEIFSFQVRLPDETLISPPQWLVDIVEKDEALNATLLEDVAEDDAAARDHADECRREDQQLRRMAGDLD
jgi:hypothetical protein